MLYTGHFKLADDMIDHLDTVVSSTTDPFIQSRYTGFVTIAAVTVYELAVKEIFIAFASTKHKVFGAFTDAFFSRLNGRIGLEDLKKYTAKFGSKYTKRFERILQEADNQSFEDGKNSPRAAYGNVIVWRNAFAHQGALPTTATYSEATSAYHLGKEVLHSLARAMQR